MASNRSSSDSDKERAVGQSGPSPGSTLDRQAKTPANVSEHVFFCFISNSALDISPQIMSPPVINGIPGNFNMCTCMCVLNICFHFLQTRTLADFRAKIGDFRAKLQAIDDQRKKGALPKLPGWLGKCKQFK